MEVYTEEQITELIRVRMKRIDELVRNLNHLCVSRGIPVPDIPKSIASCSITQRGCTLSMVVERSGRELMVALDVINITKYRVRVPLDRNRPEKDAQGQWSVPYADVAARFMIRRHRLIDMFLWSSARVEEWLKSRIQGLSKHLDDVDKQRLQSRRHRRVIFALKNEVETERLIEALGG